ncbi:hypothetical protein PC116_g5360 [Phytophthora cactorum]|uniref:Uncharacterized protein n=1 Tax=Phytophthora cactorum TaxID=29920 RepID=A0A8T1C9V0_9STRA|nr:hypothetical protein Pcac1_g13455 [Phytophthora cactorum]KAG2889019.1 hypothetical protein PC114_g18138 [Phytophthora cactorum]KAG2915430.1 hypothetical protein PC117_g18017 [Phytophthora cactorum]KAG2998296.1 hypothetical protein PC119_g17481 [Phytophthora cactorum]KAG4246857.1 hypothetical protein PC116_g5360 [Phytophthora cactorum]
MFFVHGDEATKQLVEIHERNYQRANQGGVGVTWAIPLVDNVFGLGKTTFGGENVEHYAIIRQRRKLAAFWILYAAATL